MARVECTFADRLRVLRKQKGLTQEELGEKIGMKKCTVCKYEKQMFQSVSTETVTRFARGLGVSEADLLGSLETALFMYDIKIVQRDGGYEIDDPVMNASVYYDEEAWSELVEQNNFHKVWGDLSAQTAEEKDETMRQYVEALRQRPELRKLMSIAVGATEEDVDRAVRVLDALRR